MRQEYDALWEVNREAWDTWASLASRMVRDFALGGWLMQRITEGLSGEDAVDLLRRISTIRDILDPPTHVDSHGRTQAHAASRRRR